MKAHYPRVKIGDVLVQVSRREAVDPRISYRLLGVRWYGEGLFKKDLRSGLEIKASHLYRVEEGDFVYSRLFAWKGSFAVASAGEHGSHVSNEFPSFRVDAYRCDANFLAWYFRQEHAWNDALGLSSGVTSTSRNRLSESKFLAMPVPLPPLAEQQEVVSRLDSLANHLRQVAEHLDEIELDTKRLLAVRFHKAVEGAPYRPMAEVAPVVRRSVTIDSATRYREVGARSFGKGLFLKPDFFGAEATWEKPVWVEQGDLVLSNIKAWEGAIAVAGPKHDRCIASHRYITCVPRYDVATSGFLGYYFLTQDGLDKIGVASPGTADRNRTLSLSNLGKIDVPVPMLSKQQAFDALQAKVADVAAQRAAVRQVTAALIPAMLGRVFGSLELDGDTNE